MATIEERAEKNSAILSVKFGMNEKMVRALYVAVSKEQKAIDEEDHASELLRKEEEFEAALAVQEKEFKQREDTLFENIYDWISEHYESYAAQSRGNAGVAATMTLVALREARERGEITDKEE
ncbi:MAG: hypothetical protein KBS69_06770 [Bacteroidales bacterium]|nr:hypothetical protein [Candidatus Colicola caccequi]